MSFILISIIIITLNEAENLETTINAVRSAAKFNSGKTIEFEIIVSDGGSTDGTLKIANKIAEKVIHAPKGRYKQLNIGAMEASGEILLFLHADSCLPRGGLIRVYHKLKDPCVIGGGFLKIWRWSPDVKRSKLVDFMIYFKEKFDNFVVKITKMFPGDNAIFLRKSAYKQLDGFSPMWICEDFDFSLRLKKFSKNNVCSTGKNLKKYRIEYIQPPVKTSARRIEKYGFIKTFGLWFFIYYFWKFGMSQENLRKRFKKYKIEPERVNTNILRF
ncbi:MAG: glycosyltransferase [Candidatus Hodarchaeota archaeon]